MSERMLPSVRMAMLMLWFFGAVGINMIRVNFGVSIVCMTVDPDENLTFTHNISGLLEERQCEATYLTHNTTGEYEWDRTSRGLLNSAVFFGLLASNLVSGVLAQTFNPKWVHIGGVSLAAAASLLSPLCASVSKWALFTCRFILGVGSAVCIPTFSRLITAWCPVNEKSIMTAIQASGNSIGSMVSFYLAGTLCDTMGWHATFYIPSTVIVMYLLLFIVLGSESPDDYRCISDSERLYIQKHRSGMLHEKLAIPWRCIFTSAPCVTLFVCDFCNAWGGYTVGTSGAQYMKDVLALDIKANGMYNALPPLSKFVVSVLSSILIDHLRSRRLVNTTILRKMAQSVGCMVPAVTMLSIGFLPCDSRILAVTLFCLGEGFSGFTRSGLYTIIIEIAPRYASILTSILSIFGMTAGMISPIVVGLLTPNGAESEWRTVFIIGAAMYMFGWILFMVFATADEQSWANVSEESIVDTRFYKGAPVDVLVQCSHVRGSRYARRNAVTPDDTGGDILRDIHTAPDDIGADTLVSGHRTEGPCLKEIPEICANGHVNAGYSDGSEHTKF